MSERDEYYGPGSDLKDEEVDALWREFVRTHADHLRDRLIEHYMPLVYQTAERMAKNLPSFIDIHDLIGAGNLGLIDAIGKYDPDRDAKFSTYSCRRISGEIIDELRRLDWAPRLVRTRANQLERSRDELEGQLGRRPNEDELADHMGLDEEQFEALIRETQVKTMVSLDRKWDEDDDHELGQLEMLADNDTPDPLTELARNELKEVAMRGLSDKEKLVLVMYYYEEMNLKEIGAVLDLSESRVCQIRNQALDFLRDKLRQRQISVV